MMRLFSSRPDPKIQIDFLRILAQSLAGWIPEHREQLAVAINAALQEYTSTRQGIIDAVKGEQEPPAVADDAGVLGALSYGSQRFLQMTRYVAGDYVVHSMMTDSAAVLRARFPVVDEDNAISVLMAIRERHQEGWEPERTGRRISLNLLVVHHIVEKFLIDSQHAVLKRDFLAVLGEASFRHNASMARDFFLMTLGNVRATGETCKNFAAAASASA